jgi:hypothetical protein
MGFLVKSNFIDKIGYNNIFVSEHQAVGVCAARMGNDSVSDGPETVGSNGPETVGSNGPETVVFNIPEIDADVPFFLGHEKEP